MELAGWGRFPVHEAHVSAPRCEAEVISCIQQGQAIARGNGRAYGDSAISVTNTIHMRHFNRMLGFDDKTGTLIAEAGVLLADIISVFLGRGWFPAVTPGTKFVTLGGMIAADVHGKNHHRDGGFGNFVDWIDMLDSHGRQQRCSRENNADLFAWTIGGMGLTGVILRAAIRLRRVETAWILQTVVPAPTLDATMDAFESNADATYSVAWIDCLNSGNKLGRSLVYLGEHAALADLGASQKARPYVTPTRRRLTVPFKAPHWLLNRLSMQWFNGFHYWQGSHGSTQKLVDWGSYFYPLDSIPGWNKVYGRKGFAQFQCVLPLAQSRTGLQALLDAISNAGVGSFLGVVKRLGDQPGRFSFPMAGYTLAIDFPVNPRSLRLMETLDRITITHGGRFYLAKDSRMSSETLAESDERIERFVAMREKAGLQRQFQSAQSQRLAL